MRLKANFILSMSVEKLLSWRNRYCVMMNGEDKEEKMLPMQLAGLVSSVSRSKKNEKTSAFKAHIRYHKIGRLNDHKISKTSIKNLKKHEKGNLDFFGTVGPKYPAQFE